MFRLDIGLEEALEVLDRDHARAQSVVEGAEQMNEVALGVGGLVLRIDGSQSSEEVGVLAEPRDGVQRLNIQPSEKAVRGTIWKGRVEPQVVVGEGGSRADEGTRGVDASGGDGAWLRGEVESRGSGGDYSWSRDTEGARGWDRRRIRDEGGSGGCRSCGKRRDDERGRCSGDRSGGSGWCQQGGGVGRGCCNDRGGDAEGHHWSGPCGGKWRHGGRSHL